MRSIEGENDADTGRDCGDVSADNRKGEDAQPTIPLSFPLCHLHSQLAKLLPQAADILLQILDRLRQRGEGAVDRLFHFGPGLGQLELVAAGRRGGPWSLDRHKTLSLSAVSIV